MTRNKERIEILNDIITGIAKRSSYKFNTVSTEELSQELWLKIIEAENASDKELDLNLVADICYKKIVDIQRYEMRRNHYSIEDLDLSLPDNKESTDSNVALSELFKVFPEGSKERTFLEYWGASANVGPGCSKYVPETEGKYKGGYNERDLARLLGYSDYTHRGYRRFRKAMRNFIAAYYGLEKLLDPD